MDACRRTNMYWLPMLVLAVAAAAVDFVVVFRDGDKATLSCGNAGGSCENIDWLFADTSQKAAVSLVKRGKVCQDGGTEPYRLSVKNHCSLEIMNVTVKDVGQYTCRPYWTNSDYARVQLSVVTLTKLGGNQLSCSVSSRGACRYSVRWLPNSQPNKQEWTDSQICSRTVTFSPPARGREPNREDLFTCEVKGESGLDVKLFNLSRQLEGSDAATSKPTTSTMTGNRSNTGGNSGRPLLGGWWWYVVAALGSLALIIILVAIITWKRATGNRKQLDENTGQKSGPKDTEYMAEPEDGVCYATISYTKTASKARPPQEDTNGDNGGDMVTYSTVKVSSSSARTSDELSVLYANCSKPDS